MPSTLCVKGLGLKIIFSWVLVWYWHVRIKNRVARAFAVIFAGLSFLSVLGEITIFSDLKIVEFTDFTKIGKGFFATQVFELIILF